MYRRRKLVEEKAIHQLQKTARKKSTRALKMPGYSQVKNCPFGISLYSISMALVHSRRLISRELEFLLGAVGLTLHWKQINLSSWGPSLQFSCTECWCCPPCCRDGASRGLQRQNFSETQIKVLVLFRFSRKVHESLYFFPSWFTIYFRWNCLISLCFVFLSVSQTIGGSSPVTCAWAPTKLFPAGKITPCITDRFFSSRNYKIPSSLMHFVR